MANRSASDLRAFLRERRERITPESIGVVSHGRRRVRGLRRDEVAELAGISTAWYTRFETGRAQLSIAALQRVADVLQVEGRERRRFLELARPDVASIGERAIADTFSGCGSPADALRDLARSCRSASSFVELGGLATRAVRCLAGTDALAYLRAYDAAAAELPVLAVDGPRVDRVGVLAYHSHPIMNGRGLSAVLGLALHEPIPPSPLQRAGLEAAAAVVELSLAR